MSRSISIEILSLEMMSDSYKDLNGDQADGVIQDGYGSDLATFKTLLLMSQALMSRANS